MRVRLTTTISQEAYDFLMRNAGHRGKGYLIDELCRNMQGKCLTCHGESGHPTEEKKERP